MKFLVVGPGAMGCLFSARLKIAGNEVMLLERKHIGYIQPRLPLYRLSLCSRFTNDA